MRWTSMKWMRKTALAALLSALLILAGCAPREASRTLFAMDTAVTMTAYGDAAEAGLAAAGDVLTDLEARLSVTRADSEIARLNERGAETLSDTALAVLSRALSAAEATGGAFDPTVYPMVRAWGFFTKEYRVPDAGELDSLRAAGTFRDVRAEGGTVTLAPGMAVDLGGIAKGYAADAMADALGRAGVTSAILSLGGNVRALGEKPDGSAWRVGIRDPNKPDANAAVARIRDCSVVTSGSYQRFFTGEDGTVYHHILDPETGYPVQNELLSVTVFSSDGALADAYATALFVMGKDGALAFWREQSGFEVLLMTKNGEMIATEGLRDVLGDVSPDYTLVWAS